ncbi:MAG: hypothetical protein PVG32_20565, partial [Anaerolineales bacterium]
VMINNKLMIEPEICSERLLNTTAMDAVGEFRNICLETLITRYNCLHQNREEVCDVLAARG